MFNLTNNDKQNTLKDEINSILADMAVTQTQSDEYEKLLQTLERLHKLQSQATGHKRVNADTIVVAATNLLGIVSILGFERAHVVTSKALSFVMKSK